tara:strand:- start:1693 stop:1869 length:177 start_codon:yes stop_codon:yes gene_type:complete
MSGKASILRWKAPQIFRNKKHKSKPKLPTRYLRLNFIHLRYDNHLIKDLLLMDMRQFE